MSSAQAGHPLGETIDELPVAVRKELVAVRKEDATIFIDGRRRAGQNAEADGLTSLSLPVVASR